jgi:hypothetical protein
MDRREFLELVATAPLAKAGAADAAQTEATRADADPAHAAPTAAAPGDATPNLRIVSGYAPAAVPGMPGPYPGQVVSVKAEMSVDVDTNAANAEVVREMLARGICALTGEADAAVAWRRFFEPRDVVGIKVNCGGYPFVVSDYAIVAEVVRRLMEAGVAESRIVIYERFQNQMDAVDYSKHVPQGVRIVAAEALNRGTDRRSYDPLTYVEADLFGEEDTRSNLMKLVSRELTKIVNIPNVKDHGATGATGCLKNIAYGSFSNVARTHYRGRSHTLSFVGTLASVEPLRSRTVLQILDGLRGVWHGGPFARTRRYVFYPKQIFFGTDPVAIDRLLLDIIDAKRKAEGAISIWDRSPKHLKVDDTAARNQDPNVNIIIREPGHVEYAAKLGLGVADRDKIRLQEIVL